MGVENLPIGIVDKKAFLLSGVSSPKKDLRRGVSPATGANEFTLTLKGASSTAIVLVAVIIHPFEALYQFNLGLGERPAVDETFRIDPFFSFFRSTFSPARFTKFNNLSTENKFLMIEDTINNNFAGTGIAKFVAGESWQNASKVEKKDYIRLFKRHLALNIASLMQGYSDQNYELTNSKYDSKNKITRFIIPPIFPSLSVKKQKNFRKNKLMVLGP